MSFAQNSPYEGSTTQLIINHWWQPPHNTSMLDGFVVGMVDSFAQVQVPLVKLPHNGHLCYTQ